MSGEIARALETLGALFEEGAVVEVRALTDFATHSGYFDDHAILAERAATLDTLTDVQGVYVTLNEVNPALLSRRANRIKMKLGRKDATTSDADIVRRRWLPVDLDPVRPSGVSSSDTEHQLAGERAERIAAWLGEQGFPDPIVADSGNGAHLLYRIDLPNDDAATALVKDCLATLDALFSDERVTVDTANFNAARIWKLYGTMARKGDHTPERPHRRSRLLAVPEAIEVVPDERLRHLAGLLPRDPPAQKSQANGNGIELRTWLAEHGIAVRTERPWQGGTLFVLEDCPFSPAHRDGAFAIQFPSGAVFAGCHHQSCGGGQQRWPELRDRYQPREKRSQSSEGRREPPPPPPPPAPAPERNGEHRAEALEILRYGRPLAFLLDTFNREHVGDRVVAECLVMSVASQSVANTNGLHVSISGNSGKGKTHACNTMLRLIPPEFRLKGTVSNKALYYHDQLRPGTVLLFDDVSLSEDLQEVLKSATANFREPIEHRTLTTDRQLRVCCIPERCVWWLAKVDNVGDDQVMNRMLTIWIDDSTEQDRAVLEHLKRREAEDPDVSGDDGDVHVCRAIWENLKEEPIRVTIPFAHRISFSSTANRRNPAILFDLIKCHAAIHGLQRSRKIIHTGERCIEATVADFDAAVQLYSALDGATGGQETKLTKNEAAALETIAAMGIEMFTIKMLQKATGLTYYQTYRILHGYSSRGTNYAGLLEKCPAISFVDATVAEEGCGWTIRRREHHFSFDVERYREWIGGAGIWLEKDDDDPDGPGGSCSGLSRDCGDGCNGNEGQDGLELCGNSTVPETCTVQEKSIQQSGEAPGKRASGAGAPGCAHESPHGVSGFGDSTCAADHLHGPPGAPQFAFGTVCKDRQSEGKMLPLPGLLDHREFTRATVQLGRCRICGGGKAVYQSRDLRTCICEACYARLVREWNAGKGVC